MSREPEALTLFKHRPKLTHYKAWPVFAGWKGDFRATLRLASLAGIQGRSCVSAGFRATGPTARVLRPPRQADQTQEVLRSRTGAREPDRLANTRQAALEQV